METERTLEVWMCFESLEIYKHKHTQNKVKNLGEDQKKEGRFSHLVLSSIEFLCGDGKCS